MPRFRFRNITTGVEFVMVMPHAVAETKITEDGKLKNRPDCQLIGQEGKPLKVFSTWDRGMRSDEMGINPDQRIEALEQDKADGLTGVDYDPVTGEAIFSCPSAFKAYCEHRGFFSRNGNYGSPQRYDNRERAIRGLPPLPDRPEHFGNKPLMLDEYV